MLGSHQETLMSSTNDLKIHIVTPVYWDTKNFLRLRERILPTLAGAGIHADIQFYLIDDAAGLDSSVEFARPLENVHIVSVPFNLGHQRAIVYGLRKLKGTLHDEDIIVTMDSDGEDKPEDLPWLLKALLSPPEDQKKLVLALRTKRRESFSFKVLYFFFKIAFRWLTGQLIRSGNYAVYRGWIANRFLLDPRFDLCYSSTLVALGLRLDFVPCERGSRYEGESHMGTLKLVTHGLRMLMPFLDRITIRCLVFFFVTFIAGTVLGLTVLGIRIFTGLAIPGWATNTLLALFIVTLMALSNSVLLFMIFSQSKFLSLSDLESWKT